MTGDLPTPCHHVHLLAHSQSGTFHVSFPRFFPSCFRSPIFIFPWTEAINPNSGILHATVLMTRSINDNFYTNHNRMWFSCREKFFAIVKEVCGNSFKMNIDKVLGRLSRSGSVVDDDIRSLFFGDYSNPEGSRDYDEITDLKQLTKVIEQYV